MKPDSVTFETIRTFFRHKQLVWDISRDNLKKGYEGYEGYGPNVWERGNE